MNEPAPRDQLGREETIFNAAVQLGDAAKRAIYLDLACENDSALRARIEKLLVSDAGDNFFAQPLAKPVHPSAAVAAPAPATAETQALGERIGRYRLLQKIGEGGLGLVYMAEQEEPVRRRVALKVIRLGMDTESVIARFEAERQALAIMDHPNIAKLLDAGTVGAPDSQLSTPNSQLLLGRPYFVMDLVQGLPITQFCDEAKLSTQTRLELFREVCSAVQHAHQKGIIHRDLKPSNILVTLHGGKPVPKVIDFGIAKATQQRLTDKTLFTQFQQFMGTPAYVSPEQATLSGLDIDTRSDIYSLGVLLYELLTGKTPFDSKELLKAGLDEMRRTICEKEPPTPSTRVSAMPGDELTTTAQRRGLEAPKLISQLRGDLDWIVMKCLEKDRARRYETANSLALDIQRHLNNEPVVARPPSKLYRFEKAVRRNKLALAALAAVGLSLIIGLVISTMLYLSEKETHRRALAVEDARKTEARLRLEAEAARANEAETARSREANLRRQAQAEETTAKAEAARSAAVAQLLTNILAAVGPSVARGRDTAMLKEILDKTAEGVQTDLKDQPEVQGDLNSTLAMTYRDLGDFPDAEVMQQRAVEQYRAALGNQNCKLALALGCLGYFQTRATSINEHQGKATASVGLEMARKCGDKKTLASCLFYMALSFDPFVRCEEETPYLREAVALQRELGNDPLALADCLSRLGGTDLKEDEKLAREALELHRKYQGDDHPNVAYDLCWLAECLWGQNRSDEAKAFAWESVRLARKIFSKDHRKLGLFLDSLANVLIARGEWNEAESVVRQGVEDAPRSARAWGRLGDFEARRQAWPAAVEAYAHALELDPANTESPWWSTVEAALLECGRLEACREHCHRFYQRFAGKPGVTEVPDDPLGLLLPVEGQDFECACRAADFDAANAMEEAHWKSPFMALDKGLADYRRERFQSARDWAALAASGDARCKAQGLFLQAMAFSRLQNADLASAALSAGNEVVIANHPDPRDFGAGPTGWATADWLCSEAQALIVGATKTPEESK
jgi:serine/threonine protein kinase